MSKSLIEKNTELAKEETKAQAESAQREEDFYSKIPQIFAPKPKSNYLSTFNLKA